MISFMMAFSTTSQSMRNEVVNRTLDFQRIATLSPVQILLGKLLGEPMLAFFSIIPTIPIAVYCCLILGVEGMNLPNLLLRLCDTCDDDDGLRGDWTFATSRN